MILNFVSIEQLRKKCNSTQLQICQNSQLIKKKKKLSNGVTILKLH